MNKLNISLGCGRREIEGFVGLDHIDFGWNKIWKAGDPLPFSDDEVDFIQAHNFLEHIERPVALSMFNECWRVLKSCGTMEIITPNAGKSIDLALADPTHVSLWVKGTFTHYMTGARPRNADYGIHQWKMNEVRDYEEGDPRVMIVRMSPNKDNLE